MQICVCIDLAVGCRCRKNLYLVRGNAKTY